MKNLLKYLLSVRVERQDIFYDLFSKEFLFKIIMSF